jgi:hypothetical protein
MWQEHGTTDFTTPDVRMGDSSWSAKATPTWPVMSTPEEARAGSSSSSAATRSLGRQPSNMLLLCPHVRESILRRREQTCQGVWLARLLTDMLGTEAAAPELKVDNQSAIPLSKNSVFHDRSKHINVRYHYLRDCVDEGLINFIYMANEEQLADLLMKALGRV